MPANHGEGHKVPNETRDDVQGAIALAPIYTQNVSRGFGGRDVCPEWKSVNVGFRGKLQRAHKSTRRLCHFS
jgi:hypothetical protein